MGLASTLLLVALALVVPSFAREAKDRGNYHHHNHYDEYGEYDDHHHDEYYGEYKEYEYHHDDYHHYDDGSCTQGPGE